MTNPQEPQNQIPERRQRPAAGVTFDEMIAIIVAFSTIGAILFWSLGGRKGGIASNFGLGGNSILSTGEDVAINIADANAEVDFGELESEFQNLKIASSSSRNQSLVLAPASGDTNLVSGIQSQSYGFDRVKRYAPLAGVATLPAIINSPNTNVDFDIDTLKIEPEGADVDKPVAVPVKPEGADVDKPVAVPVKPEDADVDKPVATAPNKVETPKDVVPGYWAYPFVERMNAKRDIPEFADNQNFEPDKLITRAGMATLISQAFKMKPENEGIKNFKDVSDKNAIAADVDKAVRTGFMQGYSDNEFRPLENIPRYQVLVTLATGLGFKPSQDPEQILQKFGDGADIPDWAKEQVAAASEAGLIVNSPKLGSNVLAPNQSATRAEVAAMIHQALVKTGELKPLESEYIVK